MVTHDEDMTEETVDVPLSLLTPRQLLLYNTSLLTKVLTTMTELSSAVSDLQAAVDGVAQRLLPQIDTLENALAAAQADDASAEQARVDAQNAVQAIRAEVDALNSMGADPSTPVGGGEQPVEPAADQPQVNPLPAEGQTDEPEQPPTAQQLPVQQPE